MSVYTRVEKHELEVFLTRYHCGKLVDYQGINEGIENTNYFVTTDQGQYVLTLFERVSVEGLPFFLGLMGHLAEHGIPSAHPVADNNGHYLTTFKDRPTALVQRLEGKWPREPSLTQCRIIGEALGKMHLAAQTFEGFHANQRSHAWRQTTGEQLLSHLDGEDKQLLQNELVFHEQQRPQGLPQGIIHADLFRDNTMFIDDRLTGIIDFYYACNDDLLYDVAVTVNDWCADEDGGIDQEKADTLIDAYAQQRSLTSAERKAWPVLLRAAALRFWLSRLYDLHFPRPGEITHTKDPNVFKNILKHHISYTLPL